MLKRGKQARLRRAVPLCVSRAALILTVLATVAGDVNGQAAGAERSFYVASRAGFSFYAGDHTRQLRPVFGRPNGSSYAMAFEAGYHFSKRFGLGVNYKFGNYPYAARDPWNTAYYTRRHTGQVLARFVPATFTSYLAPVLIGGLHVTTGARLLPEQGEGPTGRDVVAYGPLLGAGLEVSLSGRATLFGEAIANLSLPDRGFDAIPSSNGKTDLFGFVGLGARFAISPSGPSINMRIAGPSDLQTGAEGHFTAELEKRSAGPYRFEWNFGDGSLADGANVRHAYLQPGEYTVTLRARGDRARHVATYRVTVSASPADGPVRHEILKAHIECEEILDDAESAYVNGRFEEAIEMTGTCVESALVSPEFRIRAYRLLSLAYSSDGDSDRAHQTIHRILDINPNYQTDPVQDPPSFTYLVTTIKQLRAETVRDNAGRTGPAVRQEDYILPIRVLLFSDRLGLTNMQIAELRAVWEVVDDVQAPLVADLTRELATDENERDADATAEAAARSERAERQLRTLYRNAEQQVLQVLTEEQRQLFTALAAEEE